MKLTIALSALLAGISAVLAAPSVDTSLPYIGDKVFRVPTGVNTTGIESLVNKYIALGADTWTHGFKASSHADVHVPKDQVDSFLKDVKQLLSVEGIAHPVEVMHEDLGKSIAEENVSLKSATVREARVGVANNAWFNAYHPYADHLTFLNDLVATFPSNSRIVTTGTSVGGRAITGIHIYGTSGPGVKPAVIWHGTVHAREWISSVTVEYLAYNLLNNYANSTSVAALVNKFDYYIFPVVNPDGFVFSQTTTRLWRKNRQAPPSGSTCYGRDINRNWNVQWSQSGGASTSPCAEDYKGLSAADAPETQGLQAFLNARRTAQGAKMFVDWHSYSQLFMSPYGYSCTAVAPDRTEHNRLTAGFATALRAVYGTSYTTGPICTTIYATTGSSTDYAYAVAQYKYSFAAELRDTGNSGFVLPASQIRPSGVETWAGVQWLLANIS